MRPRGALLLLLALAAPSSVAGPPFQTDDPVPTGYRRYELYIFGFLNGTSVANQTQAPAVEFDWGAVHNVQLQIMVPFAGNFVPGGTNAAGPGDVEIGVKYRFLTETAHRPHIAVYPALEVPSGNAVAGLGNGQLWARLPIWLEKSFGPWTMNAGGGAIVNEAPGQRTYPFGGWLLKRHVTKKLMLGGEVFAHGGQGPEALNPRSAVMLDFGGSYHFRQGFQILFAGGHSVAGGSETYAYLGLYHTW